LWAEITGWVSVIGTVSLLFGYLMNRQNKMETYFETELGKKQDKALCTQKYADMKDDMARGEKTFSEIRDELKTQGKLLVQIDTTVKMVLSGLRLSKGKRDS